MNADLAVVRVAAIDAQAIRMSQSVTKSEILREAFRPAAIALHEELRDIAAELERAAPATYRAQATSISESLLDLLFVARGDGPRSLRLAALLRHAPAAAR